MNKTGCVAVKLWSIVGDLDDYLPYEDSNLHGSTPSGQQLNNYWLIPLIEKAFVKQVDSYFNLTAGESGSIGLREVYNIILGPLMDDMQIINIPATPDSATFDQFSK